MKEYDERKIGWAMVFKDTEKRCNEDIELINSIENSKKGTIVYEENYHCNDKKVKSDGNNILVRMGRTLDMFFHKKDGKVAVLNFANATHPGGGVKGGSGAQEESLCRSTTLYPCLTTEEVYKEYYEYNRKKCAATSRLIYTPDVVVFKDDNMLYPEEMKRDMWYKVDVITCAATNMHMVDEDWDNMKIYNDIYNKAVNIMEAAINHDVDVLILGAFGCGAFHNPPEVVSYAFKDALKIYAKYFKQIVFNIFHKGAEVDNYYVFKEVLTNDKFKEYVRAYKKSEDVEDYAKIISAIKNDDTLIAIPYVMDNEEKKLRFIRRKSGEIFLHAYTMDQITNLDGNIRIMHVDDIINEVYTANMSNGIAVNPYSDAGFVITRAVMEDLIELSLRDLAIYLDYKHDGDDEKIKNILDTCSEYINMAEAKLVTDMLKQKYDITTYLDEDYDKSSGKLVIKTAKYAV